MNNFWFVNGDFITRDEHNRIVDRPQGTYNHPSELQIFLGGYVEKEKNTSLAFTEEKSHSKKIFSFHGIKSNSIISVGEILRGNDRRITPGVRRVFGYTKAGKLNETIAIIEKCRTDLKGKIKKWQVIKNDL